MTMRFSQKQISFFISAALVAATLVAYEPIRHNDFVAFDDNKYITENPDIKSGITWQSLSRIFKPHFFMWHPLTTFTNMLDCELFGLNPFWHHLVSVLFHLANTLLLFWILREVTGATWPSAFVSAVFAIHPLQVESVAWAAERKTVLSGLFWLLTITVYAWYVKRPGIGRYILLFVVYASCIMTKPVVVTLPLVLLLLDYWPLERFGGHSPAYRGSPPAGKTVPMGWLLIEKVPLLLLSAFLSVMTFIAQQQGGMVRTLERFPLDCRVANMFVSYMKYIGKLIWPSHLAVIYPYPKTNLSDPAAITCIVLFVLITVFSIYAGRYRKYAAVGWLWYVGTLVPMIGLVQVANQSMADRYMYLPMLGLLVMGVWVIKDFLGKQLFGKAMLAVLGSVSLLSAVIITRTQVSYWRDTKTIFEHTLKVTKKNSIAENGYGSALFNEGRINEAEGHFRKALSIWPTYFDARSNLGKVFLKQGKYDEAVSCFTELLSNKKRAEEIHYNLATAFSKQAKYDEAAKHFSAVLKLNPSYFDTREKLGDIYAKLGTANILDGDKKAAIQNWTKALALKPDNAAILNNVAWLLATGEDVSAEDANKATGFAEKACKVTGDKNSEFLDTLAAAYAAAGRYEEAAATAQKAIEVARGAGRESTAGEIQERLKLYQSGRRYQQK
jgi:tetratricopeptide (TPR) repeat protein